jgi:hypothetical protein
MSDMSNWGQFENWLTRDEDREEAFRDLLAGIAEVWLDSNENALVMGLIGSTRAMIDALEAYREQIEADESKRANQYIQGVYGHSLRQVMSNFQALIGLTDVKKSLS